MLTSKWEMPPIAKIYEALSAIADDRVHLEEETANVISSNRNKKYYINWKNNIYSSNDNASYYQGYFGYPVIAVLMLQGKLELKMDIANHFKSINWNELNNKYKRKYDEAVAFILESLANNGVDVTLISDFVKKTYVDLQELDVLYSRSKLFPPK